MTSTANLLSSNANTTSTGRGDVDLAATLDRRAGIVACSQARDKAEAALFLDMLGLRSADPVLPAPRPTPPPPVRRAQPAPPPVPALPAPLVVAAAREPAGTLSRADAEAIRRRFTAGGITQARLAAEYQVTEATVTNAIQHGTWTSGAPVTGVCAGCDRLMVTQRAWQRDERWRQAGFARVGARGRCNSCYQAWHAHERQNVPAQNNRPENSRPEDMVPAFAASKVRVAPLYPVLCAECGLVGEAPDTREAARQLREQHIRFHRQQTPASQPGPRGHRRAAHVDRAGRPGRAGGLAGRDQLAASA
jgi:hypothetical protein